MSASSILKRGTNCPMSRPLVSVIIPCFNAEAYVADAVRSALNLSYSPSEIIVVDDGSTDGSIDVLRSFGDQILLETGPNRGACAARNRGLQLAGGDLVQFLDADDLLDPHKLEVQVPRLLSSDADAISCNVRITDLASGENVDHYSARHSDTFAHCTYDDITTPGPLHWKSNLLAVGGFDETLPCSQERDLHLRLACHGFRFEHLDETLVTVRRRPGSLSSNYEHVLETRRRIVRRCLDILEERGESTENRRRCLAGMLANDARALLRLGNPTSAQESFALARTIHHAGGLETAYRGPARLIVKLLGPTRAETVIRWKRRFLQPVSRSTALPVSIH